MTMSKSDIDIDDDLDVDVDVDVDTILSAVQQVVTDIDSDADGWKLDTLMWDLVDVDSAVVITINLKNLLGKLRSW